MTWHFLERAEMFCAREQSYHYKVTDARAFYLHPIDLNYVLASALCAFLVQLWAS